MKITKKQKELMNLAGLELSDSELDNVSGGVDTSERQDAEYQKQYADIRRLIDELANPQVSYARIRAIKQEMHDKYGDKEDLIYQVISDKFA